MKMKKSILIPLVIAIIASTTNCFAETTPDSVIREMVAKYKAENYTGCLQDAQEIIKENPVNIYAYYYQGLSYTQLGKKERAINSYNKAIDINTNKTIVEYAKTGKACLMSPTECGSYAETQNELDSFIKAGEFYHNTVQTEINQRKLNKLKNNMNNDLDDDVKKKSEKPTNDEIAEAVKTLAKAGINPMSGINNSAYTNPEMMQMNMLLSNDNSSNNNMLPYLLMMQNHQNGTQNNMSPELIQTMMMSQMQMY